MWKNVITKSIPILSLIWCQLFQLLQGCCDSIMFRCACPINRETVSIVRLQFPANFQNRLLVTLFMLFFLSEKNLFDLMNQSLESHRTTCIGVMRVLCLIQGDCECQVSNLCLTARDSTDSPYPVKAS